LIYLTGGGAWADVNYSGNMIQSLVVGPPSNFATTVSQIRSGPVVGAGYEWMITANWTLRGEFLHYWFNTTAAASATNPTGPSTAAFTWSRFDVNVARVAVNYKF
jgi:outer membrane immunogenic protein